MSGHAVSGHATTDPVLRLADEIAVQFQHLPAEQAATAVARHIRAFWDPRMRRALHAAVVNGAETDPVVRRAATLLGET